MTRMLLNPPTSIYIHSENDDYYEIEFFLSDEEIYQKQARLMTQEEFTLVDRCVGNIYKYLDPGEKIELHEDAPLP